MKSSMKPSIRRRQLAQTLARLARIPGAIAQDRVDTVVHDILKKLKTGWPVELPGLGKLIVIPTTKRTQRGGSRVKFGASRIVAQKIQNEPNEGRAP